MVGPRLERPAVQAKLVMDVEQPRRRGDEVGLDGELSCPVEQAHSVAGTRRARDADDEPRGQRAASSCWSSPDWYISIMMSEPPTNSPLTESCGIVGQLA